MFILWVPRSDSYDISCLLQCYPESSHPTAIRIEGGKLEPNLKSGLGSGCVGGKEVEAE